MRATCASVMAVPAVPVPAAAPLAAGVPIFRATMMLPKSSGRLMRASIFTTRSCVNERMAPIGKSWFSLRTALTTCSAVTPSDSMACGFRYKLISRRVPPTSVTAPAPRTFSRRFFSTWSAQLVSSTGDMVEIAAPTLVASRACGDALPRSSEIGAELAWGGPALRSSFAVGTTATDQMARLAGSNRSTRGSLTSALNSGRITPSFSRTSSAAFRPSTYS